MVYTHTGQTAELVAKYRPPVPILTLVVPHLVVDNLKWKMEGRWVQGLPSAGGRGTVEWTMEGRWVQGLPSVGGRGSLRRKVQGRGTTGCGT